MQMDVIHKNIIVNPQLVMGLEAKGMNLGMILDPFYLMAMSLGMDRMQTQHLIGYHVD